MRKKLVIIPVAIVVIIALTFTIWGESQTTSSTYYDGKSYTITNTNPAYAGGDYTVFVNGPNINTTYSIKTTVKYDSKAVVTENDAEKNVIIYNTLANTIESTRIEKSTGNETHNFI